MAKFYSEWFVLYPYKILLINYVKNHTHISVYLNKKPQ